MQSMLEVPFRVGLLCRHKCPFVQSFRSFRKPRWVPIAKSKMYRIVEHSPQPHLEAEEWMHLRAQYYLYSNSLWGFQKGLSGEEEARNQSHAKDVSEEMELDRIYAETERDNAIVRALRDKQAKEEWALAQQHIRQRRSQLEEEELRALELAEAHLKSQMERLSKCIRVEDLDEVIEKALATEVDYNFGIDKEGKVYRGRHNHDQAESIPAASLTEPISFKSEPPSKPTTPVR